jgi:succinyl-diaminopimelate desuccinylase
LQARGVRLDACVVGEPTSVDRFGDTIKNGRRGSLTGALRVNGMQCHIAYPERGRNPIHLALPALAELAATEWDRGNESFSPTSFQIAQVHAGAGAVNTVPGALDVLFNFRFSTEATIDGLKRRVHAVLDAHRVDYDLAWTVSAEPFLSRRGGLVDALSDAVSQVAGITPSLSTTGGTSDARYLARVSDQVVEFGPLSASIHGIDEHVRIADIGPLSAIYQRTIEALLA